MNCHLIRLLLEIEAEFYRKSLQSINCVILISMEKNNVIKKSAEFWLTDNAYLEIGSNCTIQDYPFFQLTKPNPRVIIGNNVTIGRHNMITAKDHLTIGDDTIIGAYVQIIDHNHNFQEEY